MREIIYRSNDLEIRRVAAGDGRRQVVTFEAYHDDLGFDRPGFGEKFFLDEGITAIHVLSHRSDWYQYPEMAAATAIIRAAVADADHVLAYGSSMGGYAAIRFADAIGATDVLALSPQYSVQRGKSLLERRWRPDRRRIRFLPEHNGRIRTSATIVVAYDPRVLPDKRHVDLIARDIPIERLSLPSSGHPIGPFLIEIGLYKTLVRAILAGTLDAAAFAADARSRSETSSIWRRERALGRWFGMPRRLMRWFGTG